VTVGIGLARVSTGSQDEASQVSEIAADAAARGITLVKIIKLHGYSASHGTQEPALQEIIAGMERGDWSKLLVTDSSRIDRREDLDEQAAVLLAIRSAGGDVISLTEPNYGQTDFAGRIVTLVAQHANAEKSKTVKNSTYRGISMIRDNNAHHGPLPSFWAAQGERYSKQAHCADPEAVRDVYERVAGGESLLSIGRRHGLYPASVKRLVRFAANHTGVEECRYTHEGVTETWAHEVEPVVESPLWWRANRVLAANATDDRHNKGGRPVAWPANWISGILDCPECGGRLYLNAGRTPAGNPRTPVLRCGGFARQRLSCGQFRGTGAQPVVDLIAGMFASDTTGILAFQRVAGNANELDALKAELSKIQARLSATEDDEKLDEMIAERKAIKARIEGFVIEDDDYDYAPTGRTVAEMWNDGDDTVKRGMARAVKAAWGMDLAEHGGRWVIAIGMAGSKIAGESGGIVDLGNGLCFRR
jgi:DNA invertase Pin-like site-specific DNA recombinase